MSHVDARIDNGRVDDDQRHGRWKGPIQRAGVFAAQDHAHAAGLHVSFDLDVCGPSIASGVGEITPILDSANQTAILGAGLALSALGKRIL